MIWIIIQLDRVFLCPALNGLMNCIVQWKKLKTKNTKSNSIEIPKIFFTLVTCKKMQIFWTCSELTKPENYSKFAYSIKVKKVFVVRGKLWKMEKYLRQQSFLCSSTVFLLVSAQRKKFAHTVHKANSVFYKKNLVGNVQKLFENS